jgi:hypothetical protein
VEGERRGAALGQVALLAGPNASTLNQFERHEVMLKVDNHPWPPV